MKSEKATQILLLAVGLVFFLVGIFRGEAAVVLSKAIKLCMECVGIGALAFPGTWFCMHDTDPKSCK